LDDLNLIKASVKMQESAYAVYSNFKVGAALLCSDGSVITGCNVENKSYGGTICAERNAFTKAVSEGQRNYEKIAISASTDKPVIPCGICLQFMSEFVSDDFILLCADGSGNYVKYTFRELLPIRF